MADRDYKAFIVEGEAREPLIIDNISKVFFGHGNPQKQSIRFKCFSGISVGLFWSETLEDMCEKRVREEPVMWFLFYSFFRLK